MFLFCFVFKEGGKEVVLLSTGVKSCKAETDTANKPKIIIPNQDKGHLFRVKGVLF